MNKADKMPTLLLDAIYDSINTASKALSRVALYVAQDPEIVLTLSVADLARRTDSGQASVVRFCRTLGFSGFREFKIALSGEIQRERAFDLAQRAALEDVHIAPNIAVVSGAVQNSLVASARILDDVQITHLSQRLRKAKRIEIYGMGNSSVCADIMTIRLIWFGLAVHSPSSVNMSHALARTLDESSIAIGISNSGVTEETRDFLELANHAGAHTLAITTRADCPIANTAKEVILFDSASTWPEPGTAMHVPSIVLLSECIAHSLRKIDK